MSNTIELRQFVEKQPWTAVTGAALVGFAFGSGLAMPILVGAGMRRTVKTWLATEVQQGLRDFLRPQQTVASEAPENSLKPGDSDSGVPRETPLARQVRRELGS